MVGTRHGRVLRVVLFCLVGAVLLPAGASAESAEPAQLARHVIVFRDGTPAEFDDRVQGLGGHVVEIIDSGGFAIVGGLSEDAAAALGRGPGILAVGPDVVVGPADGTMDAPATPVEVETVESTALAPNDQWNLRAIEVEGAWNLGFDGSRDVSVAVVDTGIDDSHPDLAGLVDATRSTSLLSLSAGCATGEPGMPATTAEDALAVGLGRPLYQDFHSHGTAVAGLIASNGVHLFGVNRETTLFAVKVHERSRRNCLSVYLAGIFHAAAPGNGRPADVIHLSIPLEFSRSQFPDWVDPVVNRAVNFANSQGAVLVAAAGNAAENLDSDPDRFRFCLAQHVVCVSATGPLSQAALEAGVVDTPSPETNFGDAIDVAGPGGTGPALRPVVGVRLVCSLWTRPTPMPKASDVCIGGGTPTWLSTGTSFGAAVTSGEAALLASIRGSDGAGQIRALIQRTADDLGLEGDDPFYGKGRINVRRAVEAAAR